MTPFVLRLVIQVRWRLRIASSLGFDFDASSTSIAIWVSDIIRPVDHERPTRGID
jgi:hypothetical protein